MYFEDAKFHKSDIFIDNEARESIRSSAGAVY